MMSKIGELAVRLANLAEAEGRVLRTHAGWFVVHVLAWTASTLLLMLGAVAALCGMTWALALAVDWPLALILMGFAVALTGAVVLIVFRSMVPPQ